MKEKTSVLLIFFLYNCAYISLFFSSFSLFIKASPLEITKLSEKEFDKRVSMNINQRDPISYLKLKVH